MSVLEGLKGTFKGVQQDIVDGLKALTSFEGHPKPETLKKLRGDGVNLDAGADLLYKYKQTWAEIDQNNKENAKQAKVVDDKVNDIFKRWEKQAEVITQLEDTVKHVPDLLQVLTQLTHTLNEVKEDFKKVEDALDELEDACDEEEFQKQMMSHTLQLQQYQQTRYSDIEKVKVRLAKEHAKRMQEVERDRNERLQERQNAFEEAFTNDLSFYKQHGRTDKLELPEISKVSSLSEITIDQDNAALDDFLASQTTTPLTDTGPDVGTEEVKDGENEDEDEDEEEHEDGDVIAIDGEDAIAIEGTFIEDDYTEDFNNHESSELREELSDLVHAKLENSDISYKSTFDTDSVEKDDAKDKSAHFMSKKDDEMQKDGDSNTPDSNIVQERNVKAEKDMSRPASSEDNQLEDKTKTKTGDAEICDAEEESGEVETCDAEEESDEVKTESEVSKVGDSKTCDSEKYSNEVKTGDSETVSNEVKTGYSEMVSKEVKTG